MKIFEVGEDEASASASRRGAKVAKREIDERINGHLAVEVSTRSHQNADTRAERAAASERRTLRALVLSASDSDPMQAARPARAANPVAFADEQRRWERDLHDGVQNELVALIVKLALAQQDSETPPALVEMPDADRRDDRDAQK